MNIKTLRNMALFLTLTLLLVFMTPIVSADTGPKPTSHIEIVGIDENYYFDLLVEYDFDVSILDDDEIQEQTNGDYYTDDYPSVLNGYQDDDGFASYTLYTSIPHLISLVDDNEFLIGYFMAPSVFKIVIVTESNNIYISDRIIKNFFNADFVFDLSDNSLVESEHITDPVDSNEYNQYQDVGEVTQDFPLLDFLLYALIGLLITLIFELGILYLLKYRKKKTFKIVIFTNLATQFILHLLIIISYYYWGSVFTPYTLLILGEAIVYLIEIIIYSRMIDEKHRINPVLYAVIANTASFILGFLIIMLVLV